MKKNAITPEQLAALRKFAAAEGRFWKAKLLEMWMRAYYPGHEEYGHCLQQVRNAGLNLKTFRFPEPPPAPVPQVHKPVPGCRYDLPVMPEGVILRTDENEGDDTLTKWSGVFPVPAIGDKVQHTGEWGTGTVVSYFVEHGWLGLYVRLDNDPAWHAKQNAGKPYAGHVHSFGIEIDQSAPVDA